MKTKLVAHAAVWLGWLLLINATARVCFVLRAVCDLLRVFLTGIASRVYLEQTLMSLTIRL